LFGGTVFVASNNKAANDIRKQLSKDAKKGKSCFTPTDDPAMADLRMESGRSGIRLDGPAIR